MRRWIAVLLLALLAGPSAALASVSVSLDRTSISLDESVNLRLTISDEGGGEPDFSPLVRDFEILSSSHSSAYKLINGTASRTREWQLTLMPRAVGVFTIPPLQVGASASEAVQITVHDVAPAPERGKADIFIEVEVDQTRPRVQAQVIYTMRLYHAVNFNSGARLSEPGAEGAEMVVQKLGDDASYQKVINGRRFAVVERRYALFPQASGELEISPLLFEAVVASRRDFFADPLIRSGDVRRVRSRSVRLQVQPIPADFRAPHWLPAHELKISESWPTQPPRFVVGEPVTRQVRLHARGLAAAQLPELEQQIPAQLRQYPDQPETSEQVGASGLESERLEKVALIATRPGSFRIPELRLKWWNTLTDREEEAVLPARDIEVVAGAAIPSQEPLPAAAIQPAIASGTPPELPGPGDTGRSPWPLLAALLGLGWLLTLLAWWWRSRPQGSAAARRGEPAAGGLRQLKAACRSGDAAACNAAVLAWAQLRWPADPPRNLGALAGRLGDSGEPLRRLEACLYAPAADRAFDGPAVVRAIESYRPEPAAPRPESQLEPLFRIR